MLGGDGVAVGSRHMTTRSPLARLFHPLTHPSMSESESAASRWMAEEGIVAQSEGRSQSGLKPLPLFHDAARVSCEEQSLTVHLLRALNCRHCNWGV